MQIISTYTASEEGDRKSRFAVLPVGSFEQHGKYLPLSTDTIMASVIARDISRAYGLFLLPPITIACSHEHAGWPGTVSISARTLQAVISDVDQSLRQSGIDKLVIVNGHGGNYVLGNIVQEANIDGPRMTLFPQANDWQRARDEAGMETTMHEDMHGGEMETSILLHAIPEVVRPGNETADHIANDRRFLLVRGMKEYTNSGIIGKPSLGTAQKGKSFLDSLTRRFAEHLEALGV